MTDEQQRECDHCGTVAKALRIWTREEIGACQCVCHDIRNRVTKKTTKKKGSPRA